MYLLENEETLIKQAKAGKQTAVARLYDELFPGVYGYTRMRLPTMADAEDIVSETFLAVVKRLPTFTWQHPGSFRAWVFQIARHQIANFYRRQDTAVALSEEPDIILAHTAPLEDSLMQTELKETLLSHVKQLSPRQQEIILLRYFGGLRNNEIALTLGIQERTVSAHLSRGLAELQANLHEDSEVLHDERS